jgi:bifunctional DNase/RNase
MNPSRPLTHDLMKNFMMAFNVELNEVVINDLQEGIFYAKLICSSSNDTVEIDSRTSDALAMAVRFGCPIYTYENILAEAGVLMEDDTRKLSTAPTPITTETGGKDNLKTMSTPDLNNLLNEVLDHEDYIKAIAIRDELKGRQSI